MFGFGKLKTEADTLAEQVKAAKKAQADGQWSLASAYYSHVRDKVEGVDDGLYNLVRDADLQCRAHLGQRVAARGHQ